MRVNECLSSCFSVELFFGSYMGSVHLIVLLLLTVSVLIGNTVALWVLRVQVRELSFGIFSCITIEQGFLD